MPRNFPARSCIVLLLAALAISDKTGANQWTGSSFFTDDWSAIDNWVGFDVADDFSETAGFLGGVIPRITPNVNQDFNVRDVQIVDSPAAAPSYTFGGTGTITVNDRIINASAQPQTFNNPVAARSNTFGVQFANYVNGQNYGRLNFNGGVVLNSSVTAIAANSGIAFGGVISGPGGLRVSGPGTVTLTSNNSFTGGVLVDGRLTLTGGGRLDNLIDVTVNAGGVFRLESLTDAINGLYGDGTVNLSGSTARLVVGNFAGFESIGNGDFDGVISGAGGLSKRGVNGTLTLDGINTYGGDTLVEEGILVANGAASATGLGDATVFASGELQGTGDFAGLVTIAGGGRLSPGRFGIADMGFNDLTIQPDGIVKMDLSKDIAGVIEQDQLEVAGATTLAGELQLFSAGIGNFGYGDRFTLIDADSAINGRFDTVDGVMTDVLRSLAVVYLANRVEVEVARPGDVNLDGLVNQADFDLISSNFGMASRTWVSGDLDGDGLATDADLTIAMTPLPLPGDYNGDDAVNAADYTVWRDNLEAPADTIPNYIIGGTIGTVHYAQWKSNFGAVSQGIGTGSGAVRSTAVPEPISALLFGFGAAVVSCYRCRQLAKVRDVSAIHRF